MRQDMIKIIFENGKRGSKEKFSRKNKFYDKFNPEVFPKKLYEKRYNDLNYSIVKKFLKSRINLKWDDVYSEYCKECNSNNYLGFKSREIINYYVHLDCKILDNGDVVDSHNLKIVYKEFYVEPNTNLLKQLYFIAPKKVKEKPKLIKILDQDYYIHENIWYRVVLENIPLENIQKYNRTTQNYDLLGDQFGNYTFQLIFKNYKKYVIVKEKQQASKKDIKQIKKYIEKYYK